MIKTLDFTDETKETVIAEQEALGWILIEEQRHFDGNHLVFERDIEAEIDEIRAKIANYDVLKARVEALEKK